MLALDNNGVLSVFERAVVHYVQSALFLVQTDPERQLVQICKLCEIGDRIII